MPEQPFIVSKANLLKVRQFRSLDDFRQWWWGDEVTQFCKDHPEQVDALKAHRFVKPYLCVVFAERHPAAAGEELERESLSAARLPDGQVPPAQAGTAGAEQSRNNRDGVYPVRAHANNPLGKHSVNILLSGN